MSGSSWIKLDSGEWGVKLVASGYPSGTMVGFVQTVVSKSGAKKQVILGPHVRHYRMKGGVHVDIYEVEREYTP